MGDCKNAVGSTTEAETTSVSEFFCDLCSLDFSAKSELDEHTWSLLHNTNLNRKKGRDCVHPCSLCNQEFVGLLDFTSHLHGDSHQENLHKWRREQQQDRDPESCQDSAQPDDDFSCDDLSRIRDSQEFCGGDVDAPIMGEYYGNRDDRRGDWGIQGPPTASRIHLRDLLQDERIREFGMRYQDQLDRQLPSRQDVPPNHPWPDDRRERERQWEEPDRGHRRMSNGEDDRPRLPRGYGSERSDRGPNYGPQYEEAIYSREYVDPYHWRGRGSEGEMYDEYYGGRDESLDSSRNRSRGFTGDRFSDGRNAGPGKRRSSFEYEPVSKANQRGPVREQLGKRNNSGLLPTPQQGLLPTPQQGRKEFKSTNNSDAPSRRRKQSNRPGSRNGSGSNGSCPGRKTPDGNGNKGEGSKENPQQRSRPSSRSSTGSSPGGKSSRKNKPRKLKRTPEKKEGGMAKTDALEVSSHTEQVNKDKSSEQKKESKVESNKMKMALTKKDKAISSSLAASGNGSDATSSVNKVTVKQEKRLSHQEKVNGRSGIEVGDATVLKLSKPVGTIMTGESLAMGKEDSTLSCEGDSVRALKEKGDSLLSLMGKGGNVPASKEKVAHVDKCNSVSSSKQKGDPLSCVKEKRDTMVTSTERGNSLSSLKKKVNSASAYPKEKEPSSSSSNGKTEVSLSAVKEKLLSLSSTKEKGDTRSASLPAKDDNLPPEINAFNRSNDNEPKNSGVTDSLGNMSTGSWNQREETLRSLLGIKKESQDVESPEDSVTCATAQLTKTSADTGTCSKITNSVSNGFISLPTSLHSTSSKVVSRHIPVLSQMSLSRPQCSFVHIDGVQCGAITWNKYCSYHQRIEEEKTQDQSAPSGGCYPPKDDHCPSDKPQWKPPLGRPGATRIFRPQTPSDDPPVCSGLVGGMAVGSRMEPGHGTVSYDNDCDDNAKEQSDNSSKDAVVPFGQIDLNSTLPTTESLLHGSGTAEELQREVDLSDTVPRPGRTLTLHGPSDANSGPSIIRPGRTLTLQDPSGVNSGPSIIRPGRTLTLQDPSDVNSGPSIIRPGRTLTLHGPSDANSVPSIIRPGRTLTLQDPSDVNSGPSIIRPGRTLTLQDPSDVNSVPSITRPGRTLTLQDPSDVNSGPSIVRPGRTLTLQDPSGANSVPSIIRPGRTLTLQDPSDVNSGPSIIRPGRTLTLQDPSDVNSGPSITRPGRTLTLHGPSDVNSGPSIDLSETVSAPGRPLVLRRPSFDSDSGPNINQSRMVHKPFNTAHRGQLIDSDRVPEIGLGETVPAFPLGSSTVSDNGPGIDLGQTVPKPGQTLLLSGSYVNDASSRRSDFGEAILNSASSQGNGSYSRSSALLEFRSNPISSASSRLQGHNLAGQHSGGIYPSQRSTGSPHDHQKHKQSSNTNTEMIDLNFSTKLLGVPHSAVPPFNASKSSPKKPASPFAREVDKSPPELIARSPRSYTPTSPQSPLSSRAASTGSGAASPGSTMSLPNLSLDLSRFNLHPSVRKALAERYRGKGQSGANTAASEANDVHGSSADGRRSQPLFAEDVTRRGADDLRRNVSAVPGRLRSQRSISLDSHITRTETLPREGPTRSGPIERGSIWDAAKLIAERRRFLDSEGSQQMRPSSHVPSMSTHHDVPGSSSSVLTALLSSGNNCKNVGSNETSDGLQRRGLIDLSSASYLKGISEPSSTENRQTESTHSRIDQVQSPERSTELPSRGLIDLNSSSAFSVLGSAPEWPEINSLTKRKRLNSSQEQERSGLGVENLVKRQRQEGMASKEDTAVTYRPGVNVHELLSIESDEQVQMQALHGVQSKLKSVRAQIQKLCIELDSLHSEENRISLRMGELRNLRLGILENACCERRREPSQPSPSRTVSVSTETATAWTETSDRPHQASFIPRTSEANSGTKEVKVKIESDADNSSRPLLSKGVKMLASFDPGGRSDYEEKDMELGSDSDVGYLRAAVQRDEELSSATSTSMACSAGELPRTFPQTQISTTNQTCLQVRRNSQPRLPNQSIRSSERSKSTSEIELSHNATQCNPRGAKSKELTVKIPRKDRSDVPGSFHGGSERGAVSAPVLLGDAGGQVQKELGKVSGQTRKDLEKKIKHLHPSNKTSSSKKKDFSDVSVSKTIEASRKKIQSVKENMKRWKQQEEGADEEAEIDGDSSGRHGSSSSKESIGNSPGSSCADEVTRSKTPDLIKPSPRKTTKELKKSSLFHSGKKSSKEARKNKSEAVPMKDNKDSKSKHTEGAPAKKRKVDETTNGKDESAKVKEKKSSKKERKVVSAVAHTTTADLGGSGTEEEIPTRDVDTQSEESSSGGHSRVSHLQIPSSTVESLKKTLQRGKAGQGSRGPLASKFIGHTGAVCGLKVHNGHLFTCSADKTTRSFDLQTGECVKMYQGHHQAVNCLEVLLDKDRLFTGSNDQTVRSYNIKSGSCTHKFNCDGRVMCLHGAFDVLFVGLSTGIVALIDLKTDKCVEHLNCHEPKGVSCLTSATEGQRKLLCSGSFDSTITIRDSKSGLLIRTLSDHTMTVLCLQVVENIVYSGSADMRVQAHNLNTGELLRSYEGHSMSVSGLQIVGRVLMTSCLDKLIRCYDLMSAELLQVYGGQMDMIFSVHVNSGKIYSGARDGSVVAVKLDLRVYHPCKWTDCLLNFGIVAHLKNHIREHHVIEQGTVEACHWAKCGHQFSAEDDIKVVLRHVLGHVVSRSARKSIS